MKSSSVLRLMFLLVILFFNNFAAQDAQPLSKSLNRFSARLYKKIIENESSNLVFSPVSLSSAFAQMYIGSRDNTQIQISQLFGFNKNKETFEQEFSSLSQNLFTPSYSSSIELINANSIWVTDHSPVNKEYIGRIKKAFNTDLFKMDFKDADNVAFKVNEWAGMNTKNKITKIISQDMIDSNTVMLLLNAVYFKDKWCSEFSKSATQDDDFFITASNKIKTPMMNTTKQFSYIESGKFETVLLPYKTNDYSMLILLPKDVDGLAALEDSIENIDVADLITNIRPLKIELSMPSFKFDYTVKNLKKSLMDLGMTDAFNYEKADFSDMLTDPSDTSLYIQKVIQKAFIEVNEEGTEAAAVTVISGGIVVTSVPQKPYRMKLDHPFLFFIVEMKTRSIMFMGRCINPKE